ncbi:MAG: hypothetical protein G01um101456_327 [Parcubacteria group bacterium Gr01-1014_56]|nr:MAG: hypothetical protein G01um101456_327 [Parcubacteria group bacterium Gr01-1014_56]
MHSMDSMFTHDEFLMDEEVEDTDTDASLAEEEEEEEETDEEL